MAKPAAGPPFPKHFDGTRFYNPNAPQPRGLAGVLQWKLTSRPEPSPRFIADVEPSVPPASVEAGEIRATLVNHATLLLQQSGSNILTDPIWSDRASPFSWIGPRRHRSPGVRKEDLPAIDLVLLSHNHYDHLDLPTLRWLTQRGTPQFIVPSGVARLLVSEKIGPVTELDWGETRTFGPVAINCVPATHFSARGPFDRNKTLWCGYTIASAEGLIYFAGDTGFGNHFAAIRERFGPPRLALLPVGAWKPRWFMSPVHMSPAEALQAHGILGAASTIAIHHGTFQLADDSLDAARQELLQHSAPESFLILKNGESASFGRAR